MSVRVGTSLVILPVEALPLLTYSGGRRLSPVLKRIRQWRTSADRK